MDQGEVLRYLVDHFGNVVVLMGLMAAGVRFLWNRIRGEIQAANKSVVAQLEKMNDSFDRMADAQSRADGHLAQHETRIARLEGAVFKGEAPHG